jgi:hypothetical protein
VVNPEQEAGPPRQLPNVTPNVSGESGQTRLLINAVEATLKELKDDVKDVKSHRHSDFVYTVSMFAVGFMLLAGMLVYGYFRIDDKVTSLSNTLTRVETKLEDLLQRIPPIPTPPRR